MPATYPGQYNTFVPNHEATQGMIVTYSRNPASFRLADWAQYKPVDKNVGYWMKEGYEEGGRIVDATGANHKWAPGTPRPSNNGEVNNFEFLQYMTERFEFGFSLDNLAADQATWDVLASNSRSKAQQCMTMRTQAAITVATSSANYIAAHVIANVTSVPGVTGKLDVSTTSRADIKRSLDHMADLIRLRTLSAVKPSQLMAVMGVEAAKKLAATPEIREYLMQQEGAIKYVEGAGPGTVDNYGLPDKLYGYKIVVEDASKTATERGATFTPEYIWPGDKLCMFARIGELEAPSGGPSASSVTVFLNEEMTVEDKYDDDNRVHRGSIVDDYDVQMTSQEASVMIEDILT